MPTLFKIGPSNIRKGCTEEWSNGINKKLDTR